MRLKNFKKYGISPAVGVILLIGITAAVATLAGIVLLDLGSPQETVTTGAEISESPDGVTVRWNTEGNAESIKVQVNGENVGELKRVNDELTIGATEGSQLSLIGVSKANNEESVVKTITTESNTSDSGSTEVKDYNTSTNTTITGSLEINPAIDGAEVQVIENNSVINTTTTQSDGSFSVQGTSESTIRFNVDGFTYDTNSDGTDDRIAYATVNRSVPDSNTLSVTINETNLNTTSIEGAWFNISSSSVREIDNSVQLQAIKYDLDENYILTSSVDASGTQTWNDGSGFESIGGEFTGVLDGNGYTIDNLYMNGTQEGLIDTVGSAGEVKNIGLTGVTFTGDSNVSMGPLVGTNQGTVSNSYSTGGEIKTAGNEDITNVGGLVGSTQGTTTNSYSTTTVTVESVNVTNVGGVSGGNQGTVSNTYFDGTIDQGSIEVTSMGGITGSNQGTVTTSYSHGTANAGSNPNLGGIAGGNSGTVQNSYATISLNGGSNTGGIVGFSGTVTNSYWDTESTGVSSPDGFAGSVSGSSGLTTSEMQGSSASSNMSNLDFTNTWTTVTSPDDYPNLQ